MGKKNDKTNVMRILDTKKIEYSAYEYSDTLTEGVLIAETLGEDERIVFKTLVTESDKKEHFVFVIPVAETLDLKAAAKVVGAKSIAMIKQKELLPLTGYIHGGCSPIGMKKFFKTTFHITANDFEGIVFSAGKIGCHVQLDIKDLSKVIRFGFADLVKTED